MGKERVKEDGNQRSVRKRVRGSSEWQEGKDFGTIRDEIKYTPACESVRKSYVG